MARLPLRTRSVDLVTILNAALGQFTRIVSA